MATNFNAEIETLLAGLNIPFAYMYYDGKATTYLTYMQQQKSNVFSAEDKIAGFVIYYDFDIYSKGNYLPIIDNLIEIMTGAGWTYQPSSDSPDMYETDTKYYHKTICFAKESEV